MGRGVLSLVVPFHRWRKAAAAGGCLEKPSCVRCETSSPETSHKRRKLFPVVRSDVHFSSSWPALYFQCVEASIVRTFCK